MSSSRLSVAAAALVLLAIVFTVAPAAANSHGNLGMCDLTPVDGGYGVIWPNGCLGIDTWSQPFLITCKGNHDMRWAASPRPSAAYTLRAGDVGSDATADVQSYIPGGTLTELHVRTHAWDQRFIGLLLYATNGTDPVTKRERQVGSWKVLPTTTGGFQVPASCGNTAVTHSGAEVKPLHVRFWFAAPKGTGNVTFRILIKEGVQGRGNFWFPAKALTLIEGVAPAPAPQNSPAVWGMVNVNGTQVNSVVKPAIVVPVATGVEQKVPVLSALGQNCADACAQQLPATPFCHRQASVGISSSDALLKAIGTQATCALPIVAGCPFAGAARVTRTQARSTCTFRSQDAASTCPSWAMSAAFSGVDFASGTSSTLDRSSPMYMPDVCFTAPTKDSQNICICTNNKAAQGSNPFVKAAIAALAAGVKTSASKKLADASQTSAAGRTSSAASGLFIGLLAAMFGLPSSRFGVSKLSLLVLATLALVSLVCSPVSAHNYMRGVHRATEASVTKPCQMKLGNDPHVQLVAGQTFEMEWTNGHGVNEGDRKTYFVILHASAYEELKAPNITDILRDYLNEASESASRFSKPDAAMWQRQHRRTQGQYGGDNKYWVNSAGLSHADPVFIQVDPVYDEKTHPNPIGPTETIVQTLVHPSMYKLYGNDRRAVYKNAAYPWIESVDEFMNPYNRDGSEGEKDFFSHQGDIARFNFEARKGAGDYIAWYSWSGYGDCVDINVMPGTTPVVNRYGRNATALGAKQYAIKVDHCEIRNVPLARTMMRVVDPVTHDVSQCINECIEQGYNGCSAVQVVRATNLADTLAWVENIPWTPSHWNQTGWDLDRGNSRDWPCRCDSVYGCKQRGCRRTSEEQAAYEGWSLGGEGWALKLANANADPKSYPNLKSNDYFCYGAKPGRNQDNQVDEDWIIADGPTDPVWFSTCYLMATSGGFLNTSPMQLPPIDHFTVDRCVSCDWVKETSAYSLTQAPFWDRGLQASADKCADCSMLASASALDAAARDVQLDTWVGEDVLISGYDAEADRAEYNAAVKAAAAADAQPADGGSSSDSLIFGLGRVASVLVLVAIGIAGLLLLAGVAFAVYLCRSTRRSSNSDLRRMQEAGRLGSTELQSNPVFSRM